MLAETLRAANISQPSLVAMGTFDGVHRGHQYLFQQMKRRARQIGAVSVVLTFHPRPREVMRPETPKEYLISLAERVERIRRAGIDRPLVVEFTPDVAGTTASEFVQLLVEQLHMVELWGGPDCRIGKGREGTPEVLRGLGEQLGFGVHTIEPFYVDGDVPRSSLIRSYIAEGNVRRAAELLGRPHTVSGEVVTGAGRGRTIGIPTANVDVPSSILLPSNGIYAAMAIADGQRWPAAASLGTRPTFDNGERKLEIHLLDYGGNLYGQTMRVEFVEFLRPETRFPDVESLLRQISADLARTRRILNVQLDLAQPSFD